MCVCLCVCPCTYVRVCTYEHALHMSTHACESIFHVMVYGRKLEDKIWELTFALHPLWDPNQTEVFWFVWQALLPAVP